MSVVRQLLQIAAVEATRGRTLARGDVYDSKLETLPDLLKDADRPVLIFSIEDNRQSSTGPSHQGFIGRKNEFKLLVQNAVASGREITDDEGTVLIAEIGETDSSYEATLNIVEMQWRFALHDVTNPWAEIFRSLVLSVGEINDIRAVDPESGRKHALRFTTISLECVRDPLPGEAIPKVIENGLAAMEADGDNGYAVVAGAFRQALAGGADWREWQKDQSALFAGRDRFNALLGPAFPGTEADINISNVEDGGAVPVGS